MATQVDLGKIRPVWKGDWAASTAYEQNDMVKVGVHSYICTAAHTSGSTFADTNWDVLALGAELPSQSGNADKVLKTDGTNLLWGAGSDVIGRAAFSNSTRVQFSSTNAANYQFLSWTYNRQSPTSDIIVQSMTPMSGSENWPDIGDFVRVNNYRTQRGVYHSGHSNDGTGPFTFHVNTRVTAAEIGTTTGNIIIALGWNINTNATESVRPADWLHPNASNDGRVPGSQTATQLLITEIQP